MPGEGNIKDAFYRYGPMYGDERCSDGKTKWSKTTFCPLDKTSRYASADRVGYFGYKVLAVSYGGTLQLFGYKGTPLPKATQQNGGFKGVFGNLGQKFPQGQKEESSGGTDTDKEAERTCGTEPAATDSQPRSTGCSWLRLAAGLPPAGHASEV